MVFICKAELPSLLPSSGGFAKDSWTDQCTAAFGKANRTTTLNWHAQMQIESFMVLP